MELSEENGFINGRFRDPTLRPSNADIYEVDSLPEPFGRAIYTYDLSNDEFQPTTAGIDKINRINKRKLFRDAENNLENLETDLSKVIDWLLSHLLTKGTILVGDIPANIETWRQDYAAAKQQQQDNKPQDE